MYLITILIAAVVAIVVLSARLKVHPFLALLFAGLMFGMLAGMPFKTLVSSINEGFAQTLGKIGMVIVLGVIIGEFLEKSGGALTLANRVLKIIGKQRVAPAMGLIGYIVSIPVFADSGFIILTPLNKTLTRQAGLSFGITSLALVFGLISTHTMVPPTPGPIAAASALNANLGLVLLVGMPVSFGAMLVCLFYSVKIVPTHAIQSKTEVAEEIQRVPEHPPGLFKSSLPIFIPIALIILSAVVEYSSRTFAQSGIGEFLKFIGEPVIALTIGFLFALILPHKRITSELSEEGWVGKALKDAAIIILITGAGGAFGKILQNSGIANSLGEMLSRWNLGLWLPFLLAAAIKSAQGSSTVSLITTASILAPMMISLGFDSELDKALVVVAIGAGSAVVSHLNDSLFWIFTQVTGMDVKSGLKYYTPGTLLLGLSAMLILTAFQILSTIL
jgi:gluconate:H+ symporter, GntP family